MSYLEQYDRIPSDQPKEKVQLVNNWLRTSWRDFFAELRENRPIFKTPGYILVTRFDDVQEILSRSEIFTVKLYVPRMDPAVGPFMLARDNTEINYRDKSIMKTMLQWKDLQAVRKMSGDIAKAALDKSAETGKIEVVSELARYVPVKICGEYFGFPGPDRETMYKWSIASQWNMFKNLPNDPQIQDAGVKAGQEMREYLAKLLEEKKLSIAQKSGDLRENKIPAKQSIFSRTIQKFIDTLLRRKSPPCSSQASQIEDIFTRLIKTRFAKDLVFDESRIITNMAGLLVGSVETTSQAIVQIIEQIILQPNIFQEALQAAQENDNEKFDQYVWEALRFNPINPLVFRLCEEDYTLASGTPRETVIPAQSIVFACTASAMFDAVELQNPETFSIERPSHHYMHFGYGEHICLGKYVSLVEIPEVVKQVLLRPGVKLLEGDQGKIDFQDTPFPQHFVIAYDR
ncbi:MAG: cytochrome P450 [Prochloraceae cyanobacterium]